MDFHVFAPVLRAGSTPGVLSSPEQVWRLLPKWLVRTRIQAWFLDVVWAILQFAAAGRGRSCSSMCSPASGHVPASQALSLKPVDVPQGPDVTSSASAGTPGLLDTTQDTLSRAPLLPFCTGQSCLQLPHRGLQGIKHEYSVPAHQECYLEGLDQSLGGRWWLSVNLSVRPSFHRSSGCRNRSSTRDKTRTRGFSDFWLLAGGCVLLRTKRSPRQLIWLLRKKFMVVTTLASAMGDVRGCDGLVV